MRDLHNHIICKVQIPRSRLSRPKEDMRFHNTISPSYIVFLQSLPWCFKMMKMFSSQWSVRVFWIQFAKLFEMIWPLVIESVRVHLFICCIILNIHPRYYSCCKRRWPQALVSTKSLEKSDCIWPYLACSELFLRLQEADKSQTWPFFDRTPWISQEILL